MMLMNESMMEQLVVITPLPMAPRVPVPLRHAKLAATKTPRKQSNNKTKRAKIGVSRSSHAVVSLSSSETGALIK